MKIEHHKKPELIDEEESLKALSFYRNRYPAVRIDGNDGTKILIEESVEILPGSTIRQLGIFTIDIRGSTIIDGAYLSTGFSPYCTKLMGESKNGEESMNSSAPGILIENSFIDVDATIEGTSISLRNSALERDKELYCLESSSLNIESSRISATVRVEGASSLTITDSEILRDLRLIGSESLNISNAKDDLV